jgi:hypothetical protein
MQDDSYDDGHTASGHEDAEKIEEIASLLARQVRSAGSKDLQRKNPLARMILPGQA